MHVSSPVNILLQTTIPRIDDDWHIGRFVLLKRVLEGVSGDDGAPLYTVTARDRGPVGQPDPVLSTLGASQYGELWLMAVDVGDGLTPEDCSGISAFRRRGGGLMVTRDHMDLGCSVCGLPGIGAAHHFHSHNPNPEPARRRIDDPYTTSILWPNYHSGANGDYQRIQVMGAPHPVFSGVEYLPTHPHEGDVGAPADDPTSRVIATSRSKATRAWFNIAVAFERSAEGGRVIAQSTFHHFADYNWDTDMGAPSFVNEPPGHALADFPEARQSTERYVRNLAQWLSS